MRRSGQPSLVTLKDRIWTSRPLERLPLNKKATFDGQEVSESWLQNILDQVPSLLPVDNVDERVMPPLFSLGREIPTPSGGSIDNLFLSKNGYLVIVETKLWRNPEARRTVVAQILEYAADLRSWEYAKVAALWKKKREDLQRTSESAFSEPPESLWQAIQPEELEEQEWIDLLNENLRVGRMTLLVVGDGIQAQAEKLTEVVNGCPDFPFRLGLIELRLYQCGEREILIVPATMAKTLEIERAIVRVVYSQQSAPSVKVEVPPSSGKTKYQRNPVSEDAFRAELLSSSPDGEVKVKVFESILRSLEGVLLVDWQVSGFSIKFPAPRNPATLLSLGGVSRPGNFWCLLGYLRDQLVREGWKDEAIKRVLEAHHSFLKNLGAKSNSKREIDHYDQYLTINLSSLSGKEDALVDGLKKTAELIEEEAQRQDSITE